MAQILTIPRKVAGEKAKRPGRKKNSVYAEFARLVAAVVLADLIAHYIQVWVGV